MGNLKLVPHWSKREPPAEKPTLTFEEVQKLAARRDHAAANFWRGAFLATWGLIAAIIIFIVPLGFGFIAHQASLQRAAIEQGIMLGTLTPYRDQ